MTAKDCDITHPGAQTQWAELKGTGPSLPVLQRLAYNMPKHIFADWLNGQISQQAIVLRGTPFPEQGSAYVLLLHAPDQDFPTVARQWEQAYKCLSHVTGRLEHTIGSRCLYLVIHHVLKSNTSQYKPQLVKSSDHPLQTVPPCVRSLCSLTKAPPQNAVLQSSKSWSSLYLIHSQGTRIQSC